MGSDSIANIAQMAIADSHMQRVAAAIRCMRPISRVRCVSTSWRREPLVAPSSFLIGYGDEPAAVSQAPATDPGSPYHVDRALRCRIHGIPGRLRKRVPIQP